MDQGGGGSTYHEMAGLCVGLSNGDRLPSLRKWKSWECVRNCLVWLVLRRKDRGRNVFRCICSVWN